MFRRPLVSTFHKGVAISVWQSSSDPDLSQWTEFSKGSFGGLRNCNGPPISQSCDFWNRYEEDIELAHKLGCNSFRLSIEWARIQPQRGVVDNEAVRRYHEMLDVLDRLGMEVIATLHHFVHPKWFDDIGGFTVESNIGVFAQWARLAYVLFSSRIRMWLTMDEPSHAVFMGWIGGMHPPGKVLDWDVAGRTLLHMLRAHSAAYDIIKAMPSGKRTFVGLAHHHIIFESWHSRAMPQWLPDWWGRDVVVEYMTTGRYKWHVPLLGKRLEYQEPRGRPPCDWWGINCYTRAVTGRFLQPALMPLSDMGLYQCIQRMSKLGIPMYVTQMGAPYAKEKHHAVYIDLYLKSTLRAVRDGYDVRGFYYCTLVDSYEWNLGFTNKFGLYSWDPQDKTGKKDRKLKEGAKKLAAYYKELPETLPELRAATLELLGPVGTGLEEPKPPTPCLLVALKACYSAWFWLVVDLPLLALDTWFWLVVNLPLLALKTVFWQVVYLPLLALQTWFWRVVNLALLALKTWFGRVANLPLLP